MEALRRLRRNSSDVNVDRRLVTNIVLQFLTTPRADAKRFEMLTLLASILSWNDEERERAGLQRGSGGVPKIINTPKTRPAELDKTDETEVRSFILKLTAFSDDIAHKSFSRLWVEFLLTEAASGSPASTSPTTKTRSPPSLPSSPILANHRNMSNGGLAASHHQFGKAAANASTPELSVPLPRKGKEKAES
jgi:hypothetical protein